MYTFFIILFLIVFVLIALQDKQVKNFKEFAIGRGFSNFEIVISWLAMTASVRYVISNVIGGFYYGALMILDLTGEFVKGYFQAFMVKYIRNDILKLPTISEAYSTIFKMPYLRRFIAIVNIGTRLSILINGLLFLDFILGSILKVNNPHMIELLILITIAFYSTRGGIASVIKTDIMQTFFFLILIPTSLLAILPNINFALSDMYFIYPAEQLIQDPSIPASNYKIILMEFLPMLAISIFPRFSSGEYQRIITCSSKEQASITLFMKSNIIWIFACFFGLMGIILRNMNPTMISASKKELETNIILSLIDFKGNYYLVSILNIMFLFGILALFMSTIDTYANIFATYVSNDLIYNFSEENKLKITSWTTVFYLGLSYILFLITATKGISMLYIYNITSFATSLSLCMFSGTFELGLLGFIPKRPHLIIGMIIGFITNIAGWYFYTTVDIESMEGLFYILIAIRPILGVLMNIATVIILSLLFNHSFFSRKKDL